MKNEGDSGGSAIWVTQLTIHQICRCDSRHDRSVSMERLGRFFGLFASAQVVTGLACRSFLFGGFEHRSNDVGWWFAL